MKSFKMKSILFLIFVTIFSSCSKVEPVKKVEVIENFETFVAKKSQYISDESSNIFDDKFWYIYDEPNHIIWPTFNIYSIRSKGEYYKLQIIDYYDDRAMAGNYTLRVQKPGEEQKLLDFYAQGCGNVYTNPTYDECLEDPEQNIFTYVSLNSGDARQLSDADALLDYDWDIAFNGTQIRLNSGKFGPGDTRAANVFAYTGFFPGGIADFQKIAKVSFGDKGQEFFDIEMDLKNVPFVLPSGVDRVINEPDWFIGSNTNVSQLRSENSKNWWIVRSKEGSSYTKLNFSNITESIDSEGVISTSVTLSSYYQSSEDEQFSNDLRVWTLDTFDTTKSLLKICLDLDTQAVVKCSKGKKVWDIKLSVLNRKKKRLWRVNISNGAIGPLSLEDINSRVSGRE